MRTGLTPRLLRYYFLSGALEGLLALAVLLGISTDPKNAWFLGYSKSRLLMASVLLLALLLFLWLYRRLNAKTKGMRRLQGWLEAQVGAYGFFLPAALTVLILPLFGTFFYLYFNSATLTTLQGVLLRLAPFALFALARSLQLLLVLFIAAMGFRNSEVKEAGFENALAVNPEKIAAVLGLAALFLLLADVAVNVITHLIWDQRIYGLSLSFDLNLEQNFPTYFSAALLLVTAALSATIAILKRNQLDAQTPFWLFLAAVLLFLSLDEAALFHEMLGIPLREVLGTGGLFFFTWVVLAIPLTLIFMLAFRNFFRQLPARTRSLLGTAFVLYVLGALGGEMLGGWYADLYSQRHATYDALVAVEESLEMAGVIILVYALLDFLRNQYARLRFRLES